VQAALLRPHGLRRALAPTTDYRSYYDELPEDPLAGAAPIVRLALARAEKPPFAPHLHEALAATEAVTRAAARFGAEGSLFARVEPAPPKHPLEFLLGTSGSCGDCVWRHTSRGVDRCRHAADARVDKHWPGCERWEPELDCQDCGACCREAYHSVTVPRRDPVVARHPELVVRRNGYVEIRRVDDRCAALTVDAGRYACTIYADRPRPCREFERAGANCLEARRRVGLAVV